MKRAIEDSFPIVEINRLAVPERNSFKPIYQMHKWFARRASCVFRAILLGALKPLPVDKDGNPTKSGAEVIMDEFYRDHTDDPDTKGKQILDPFMGGGTTVVEALRLGCNVTGIDLNPVAWFIVKTEAEPVDLDQLREAFDRLAERKVEWSGRPLRDTLLDLYKTACPSCGGDVDTIYTFWVKEAPCTSATCRYHTPLFSDYVLSRKSPSIRYMPDCDCPKCGKVFDWELEPACMVGNPSRMVDAAQHSAGHGRSNARWAYGYGEKVKRQGWRGSVACPWCGDSVLPLKANAKPRRKRVELTVLLCPKCEEVWQYRGGLPEQVRCPSCGHGYRPHDGNVPAKGRFLCRCGNEARVIDACKGAAGGKPLPLRPIAAEAYCPHCARRPSETPAGIEHGDLFAGANDTAERDTPEDVPDGLLWKAGGKYFSRITPRDLRTYQKACAAWEQHGAELPHPKAAIPRGEKTKTHLLGHNYVRWEQLFNPRQLLGLSTVLQSIACWPDEREKGMFLSNFQMFLERNSMFCRYYNDRNIVRGMFSRHDFHPLNMPAETNLFGDAGWGGTWDNLKERLIEAKRFNMAPFDWKPNMGDGREKVSSNETIDGTHASLSCADSRTLATYCAQPVTCVITDPPYADNVNYAELADFFYVWLRLGGMEHSGAFAPEACAKQSEIVENKTRGTSEKAYADGLRDVFSASAAQLPADGLMAFTFHHRRGSAWERLVEVIMEAGLELVAVYPIHGDSETSMHLMGKEGAIAYDLIHVCRIRAKDTATRKRSWAGIRQQIRQKARAEIQQIENGRYGNEPLPSPDVNIILIGKCLELYSSHFGEVVDHEGNPLPLHAALEEIRMLVDQLTTQESALPSELEDVDAPSYVYLTCLCDRKEIKSDEVHKATRGICEPSTLMERDLMIKGRAKRGRTYEVKQPLERLDVLRKKFGVGTTKAQQELFDEELEITFVPGVVFVDYVHLLLGLVENGENVIDWLDKFRGRRPEIRAALEYMARKNRGFADPVRKIIGLMDEKTLFNREEDTRA